MNCCCLVDFSYFSASLSSSVLQTESLFQGQSWQMELGVMWTECVKYFSRGYPQLTSYFQETVCMNSIHISQVRLHSSKKSKEKED